ncbi:DUF5667 domain-containing protein [Chloroflexota bacterium]
MKKRKELDNILNECLERILTRGETIEQCLASYPEQAAELEPLLQTFFFAKKAAEVKPRPEFRDRARYQLRVALQEMAEKRERRFSFFSWQPRWATVVVAVLVFVLASGSTVAASGNSMPDGTLYPVKLATERVRLALTFSALDKAELYARLADKRVTEIISMVEKGKLKQMEQTTQRLDAQLVAMANLVGPPAEEAGVLLAPAPTAPSAVEVSPEEETAVMMAPPSPSASREVPAPSVSEVPAEEKPAVTMAPASPRVTQKVRESESAPEAVRAPTQPQLVVEGEGAGEVEEIKLSKRAKLRVLLARNAVKHPAALKALLQKVPPSAQPALLEAIAASDTEYKKVLEALEEGEGEGENRGGHERGREGG